MGGRSKCVVVDGKSDPEEFARLADKLLTRRQGGRGIRLLDERQPQSGALRSSNGGRGCCSIRCNTRDWSSRRTLSTSAGAESAAASGDRFPHRQTRQRRSCSWSAPDYVFPRDRALRSSATVSAKCPGVKRRGRRGVYSARFIRRRRRSFASIKRELKPDAIVNTLNGSAQRPLLPRTPRVTRALPPSKVPTLSREHRRERNRRIEPLGSGGRLSGGGVLPNG